MENESPHIGVGGLLAFTTRYGTAISTGRRLPLMRAEVQQTVDQVQQAITLLRRHL
jgi:hypothetical protein